jgi:hypothetical protein
MLASANLGKNLAWWNFPIAPEDELWLFMDTVTGLPVNPELHNERWHRVRSWVGENDPENSRPRTIVYRNLRHHAATKWFHDELGESWEVVAQYLGDKLTTVVNHPRGHVGQASRGQHGSTSTTTIDPTRPSAKLHPSPD